MARGDIPRSIYIVCALTLALGVALWPAPARSQRAEDQAAIEAVAAEVDALFAAAWRDAETEPAPAADSWTVVRRLSLTLTGTIPSLEEIRRLERLPDEERVDAYLDHVLADRRFADYFAERLARAFVGTRDGPFLVFRRRRFTYWLSDEIAAHRPYDRIVERMIAGTGLWTDRPETNFITAHERDPVQLTARTTRAFLGMRLDCAQCHDHPFAHWKQEDFLGLAAFYRGIDQKVTGIVDGDPTRSPEGRMMMSMDDEAWAALEPRVPFAHAGLPEEGSRRERLARWLTHTPAFGRAAAHRVWTMMMGQPLTTTGVDDIEGPERVEGIVARLGEDFSAHPQLRRMIRIIAHTRAFRLSSRGEAEAPFARFPLTPLRPEQIAGAIVQASQLKTIDADSHVLWRLMRFGTTRDFVARYGDAGEDELAAQEGTIAQRLVMMNGGIVEERTRAELFTAAGRIAKLAPDDETRVEVAFLTCLTRRPTETERARFVAMLENGNREREMEDLLWALVNTTEFAWLQ